MTEIPTASLLAQEPERDDPRPPVVEPKRPGKIACLDGLRGIAALVVVFAHFRELVFPLSLFAQHVPFGFVIERSPLMLLTASSLAVRIFFVHSGFVLSWKYLNEPDQRILFSMALRRAFRLGIPIAVAILFAFTLMRLDLMRSFEMGSVTFEDAPLVKQYEFVPSLRSALSDSLGGWFFAGLGTRPPGSIRYDGALWTMPIELICSYAVFLILPLIVRLRARDCALVLLAASVGLMRYYPWLVYFFIGILLVRLHQARLFEPGGALHNIFRRRWVVLLAFGAATVLGVWPEETARRLRLPAAVNPLELVPLLSASLFLILLFALPGFRRILELPAIQFLGRLSFAVYLLHIPILCSLSSGLFLVLHRAGWPYGFNSLITLVVTLMVAYGLSYVMWRWVDRFSINFGKATLYRYLYRPGGAFAPRLRDPR